MAAPTKSSAATPLHAAAAILVLVALSGIEVRLDPAPGWMLLLYLVGGVVLVPWALAAGTAEGGAERISGVTTTLLLAALYIVLSFLTTLAEVLGADGGSGSITWVALVFAAVAAVPGWRLGSPICALLSSAALGVAFIALVDLVFGVESLTTFRWLLLVLAIAYAAAAVLLLNGPYRHAVQHISAAGLAITALVLVSFGAVFQGLLTSAFLGSGGSPSFNGPLGWELVGIAGSGAVIAFAVARREPGPGFIGAIALSTAVGLATFPEADASLIGWPLLFILAAVAAVAAVFVTGGGNLPGPRQAPGRNPRTASNVSASPDDLSSR